MNRDLRNVLMATGVMTLSGLVGSTVALADILASTARTGAIDQPGTVPLNDSGGAALAFTTTKPNQKVVITYNAECLTRASWLSVSIFVDGREANPASGTDFAFCSAPGNWHAVVRQSVFTVPRTGAHAVTVSATPVGGGSFTLDDSSLVVEK